MEVSGGEGEVGSSGSLDVFVFLPNVVTLNHRSLLSVCLTGLFRISG